MDMWELMDKQIKAMEEGTIVTNPKERYKTFFRKLLYRQAYWTFRLKNALFGHRSDSKHSKDD